MSEATRDREQIEAEALRVFFHSLEIEEEQRSEWLEHECSGQPELLGRVRKLIRADRGSTGFLESPPVFEPPDFCGHRLGAFELVEQVAVGGMSTIYRGRRIDGTYDQQVAIKLFDGSALSGGDVARFEAERRILAAMDHPGIARIIDGGTTPDGTPYVVMEWVDGAPVTRYCNDINLDLEGRLALLIPICEALDAAHRRGVVHRDIKPGNVLVDVRGQPRLIDFGIAKVLEESALALELPATRQGAALMTPEYASPEQLRGGAVAATCDVYALGVLLYELVTGSRPHQITGMSPAEMERTVCGTVPVDPSAAVARRRSSPPPGLGTARRLGRRLRGDLDRIIMTALRIEPAKRYATALELGADLERYLAGKPVAARGASRLYRATRFVDRHRAGVAATAMAFIALTTALVMVRVQAEQTRQQRDRALVEAQRAESAKQFLTEMIQRADPFENAAEPTLAGALRQAIPGIAERFAGQPRLEADLRYAIGYALQNLGEVAPARVQLEHALELHLESGASAVDLAEIHDGLGIVAWWESNFEQGEDQFQRALELLEDHNGERARVMHVNVLANWAGMMIDAGDSARSERLALRALAFADGVESVSAETLAAIWSSLATARDGLGRSEEALAAFERTLEIQREATGEMHPSYAMALNNMALMYHGMGRLGDATSAMQRSVEIRRATLGESHPQTATALFNLARLQTIAGDFELAEHNARTALTVAQNGYDAGHPRIGKAHEALAIVLEARGVPAEALEHARRAGAIYQQAAGVDPAWIMALDELIERIGAGASAAAR